MTAELDRIAWLCGEFCRNVAHYRAGYDIKENKDLFDPSVSDHTNFWCSINGNALDMAVLHWCKLFSEKKNDQHTWDKHVLDKDAFMLGLLAELRISPDEYKQRRDSVLHYRDKRVAHLDSEDSTFPYLDWMLATTKYLYNHFKSEASHIRRFSFDLDFEYSALLSEAKAAYNAIRLGLASAM